MSIKHPLPLGTAVRYLEHSGREREGCGFIIRVFPNCLRFDYRVSAFPWTTATEEGDNEQYVYMYDTEIVEVLE